MSGARPMREPAKLSLVTDLSEVTAPPIPNHQLAWAARRPAVLRLCAGEALTLHVDEVDFVELANSAENLDGLLLDDSVDPDLYTPAEVAVEYYCTRYGVQRHAKGDRVKGVESTYRRYLIPFLVELSATRPPERRGVADLRIAHLETLPRMLAGMTPLPAATVAGDLLRRRGIACLFLDPADAAEVTTGGQPALELAIAAHEVPLHRDVRTGHDIIATADLRRAGLLRESDDPHGIEQSSARNVLRDLALALERARDHGARVRGKLQLNPIEPLPDQRLRAKKPHAHYISLSTIAATSAHMRITGQVVLWIARLLGPRISEIYGFHVTDFVRDEADRPWLVIDKQGGVSSLGRDPKTGKLRRQDEKQGTKSPAGVRTIPIPRHLGALLDAVVEVFHTDADTGQINWTARLIPGIRKEDVSGQSSMYGWLKKAQQVTGDVFDRHDLRDALITDLKDAGVDARLAHYYAGHEQPDGTIQDRHYDLGPYAPLLHPIADLLDAKILAELGTGDLRQPTALRESWGQGTRRYRQRAAIEQRLVASGWGSTPPEGAPEGRLLKVPAVAQIIGRSVPHTRRLMRDGDIAAHTRSQDERQVWFAYETDVQRYLAENSGVTIADLTDELGRSYNQVWHLMREIGLLADDHQHGASHRLTAEAADRLRVEAGRRDDFNARAVSVQEASELLGMQVVTVETLIRQGQLELVDEPGSTRRRYVLRASIDGYISAFPPVSGAGHTPADVEEALLTFTEARLLLGVRRPHLTELVSTRQVLTGEKPKSRHLYITASSAIAWAERTRRPGACASIRSALQRRSGPGVVG